MRLERVLLFLGLVVFVMLVAGYVTNTIDYLEYASFLAALFTSNSPATPIPITAVPVPGNITNTTERNESALLTTNATANAAIFVRLLGRDPPPNFANWTDFVHAKQCDPDMRHYLHLERLFDFWHARGGIKRADIEAHVNGRWAVSVERGFWKDGQIHQARHRFLDQFKRVYHLLTPKVFHFILRFHDEPTALPSEREINSVNDLRSSKCVTTRLASYLDLHGYFISPQLLPSNVITPILSATRLPHCTLDIPVPLWSHARQIEMADKYRDPVAWEFKRDALFHRGSLTGGLFNHPHWRRFHRVRLMAWSQEYENLHPGYSFTATADNKSDERMLNSTPSKPFYIDIGFPGPAQPDNDGMSRDTAAFFNREYAPKGFLNFSYEARYKYLLVVDGWVSPDRMYYFLTSNSVVLYAGLFLDWFIGVLEPYVHYVPVNFDYSDLEERVQWLRENDDKARQIVRNANELMKYWFTMNQMDCYSSLLLLEYQNLYS